jgi:hypothetical protein
LAALSNNSNHFKTSKIINVKETYLGALQMYRASVSSCPDHDSGLRLKADLASDRAITDRTIILIEFTPCLIFTRVSLANIKLFIPASGEIDANANEIDLILMLSLILM